MLLTISVEVPHNNVELQWIMHLTYMMVCLTFQVEAENGTNKQKIGLTF